MNEGPARTTKAKGVTRLQRLKNTRSRRARKTSKIDKARKINELSDVLKRTTDPAVSRLRSMASETLRSFQACRKVPSCQGRLSLQTDTEALQPLRFAKKGLCPMARSRDCSLFLAQESRSCMLRDPFTRVARVPKGLARGSPTKTPCDGCRTDFVYASSAVLPRK